MSLPSPTDPTAPDADYWVTFWQNDPMVHHPDPQAQVGRTLHKVPIDAERWQFHRAEIERTLALEPTDDLLDLCAGNGLISLPLSERCASVTVVDVSAALLANVTAAGRPNVRVIEADVRSLELPAARWSRGLMYGALQYFSERETIGLFEKMFHALRPGGFFLVGDIPDRDRLFHFHNRPEWVAAYFESLKRGTPTVGHWFKQDFLLALARHVGFQQAEVLPQHPRLLNAHYRFDLRLTR